MLLGTDLKLQGEGHVLCQQEIFITTHLTVAKLLEPFLSLGLTE